MLIVSGALGYEKIHYEAPPSIRVAKEMTEFIYWFNNTRPNVGKKFIPGPVRAAIAHLYFESIHPFVDGNGRIGRAIAEKALSQDINAPVPFSLSTILQKNKKSYYEELAFGSRKEMEITPWIRFFVTMVCEALREAKSLVSFSIQKLKFWQSHETILNERQKKVLKRIFQSGTSGFEGGLNAKKYMAIANCSKATATRDLSDLLQKGCLTQLASGGRSTRYEVSI